MKTILVILSILGLSGCTSLQYAGVSHYKMAPVVIDGKPYCCEIEIFNGKEIAVLDAKFVKKGDDVTIVLKQVGVEAFQGQQIAGDALSTVVDGIVEVAP